MSANTRQEMLARLATLTASAVDLINKGGREPYETWAFFDALQWYKDGTLGWVEHKLAVEEHRKLFLDAVLGGSIQDCERLLDSLREFGVGKESWKKLKDRKLSLLALWQIPTIEFLNSFQFPAERTFHAAIFRLQEKVGIKKPVHFPVDRWDQLLGLEEECRNLKGE